MTSDDEARSGGHILCQDLMTSELETVAPGDTVQVAARKMRDLNVGLIPVCGGASELLGLVTDRDITLRVVAEGLGLDTRVEEIMTTEIVSCRPRDEIARAEDLMRVNLISRIPCIDDDGRLVGLISLADVAQVESPRRTGELLSDIIGREIAHP